MNVMIYNKYKDLLLGLNIDVMKSLDGVYNVDEIIDTFTNFYYDKMILDITAIRDYQNTDNLQKLAMNINMENVILLLDNTPESDSKEYLSKLISLGIYNFTKNADGINYLLVHPHSYRDVVNIHNLQELDAQAAASVAPKTNTFIQDIPETNNFQQPQSTRVKIIGFKNVTPHAGSTSLIYMIKKQLGAARRVTAVEVNRVDFLYFNEPGMISTTNADIFKTLMKSQQESDVILLDLNDYTDLDICSQVLYLIEPSTIMVNKMMRKNKNILDELKDKDIILNRCPLSPEDVATFEYETKLKVLASVAPVDDRQAVIGPVKALIDKLNL